MEKSIYENIKNAQQGSKEDMLYLIEKFMPLIKKKSYLLRYDDAIGDVTLAFIEVIHKIKLSGFVNDGKDYDIISYIQRSIHNAFISFSIKNCDYYNVNQIFDEDIIVRIKSDETLTKLELKDMLSTLSELQRTVIVQKYFYGYSDEEIGNNLSISRQAVNRAKNRAFECIRNRLGK